MSDLGPLWRMVRHVPPERLLWRAAYRAKRVLRRGLAERGFATPLAHGTRARPRDLADWPQPHLRPTAPAVHGDRIDLHGYEVPLVGPIPWTHDGGFAGTDLQWVHLHEHGWIHALDDARLIAVVDDWMSTVRPYGPRYWVAPWNGYTLAARVLAWIDALTSRALPLPFVVRVQASLLEQIAFLSRNLEVDLRGNHLLRNWMALAWGARCFEGQDADRWLDLVLSGLDRELGQQFLADGLHFELSPSYHLHVMLDLLRLHQALGERATAGLRETLARAAEAAAILAHPDGGPSLFSDGGVSLAPSTRTLLDHYAVATGLPAPGQPSVRLLEHSGYAVYRGPDHFLVADTGPIAADDLPAHGHADALSFEWSVGSHRVIVDPGTPTYAPGPERLRCRGTAAHNTVTVDDADQAELFGSFRLGRRARVRRTRWAPRGDGFVLAAEHDGYRHLPGAPVHQRRFDIRGDRVRIEDRVEGGASQRTTARLLLHPEVQAKIDGRTAQIRVGEVVVQVEASHPLRVEEAQWSPDFGVLLPTRRLIIDYGPAPSQGHFTLTIRACSDR